MRRHSSELCSKMLREAPGRSLVLPPPCTRQALPPQLPAQPMLNAISLFAFFCKSGNPLWISSCEQKQVGLTNVCFSLKCKWHNVNFQKMGALCTCQGQRAARCEGPALGRRAHGYTMQVERRFFKTK